MSDNPGRDTPFEEMRMTDESSSAISEVCAGCGLFIGGSQISVRIADGVKFHATCFDHSGKGLIASLTAERDTAFDEIERLTKERNDALAEVERLRESREANLEIMDGRLEEIATLRRKARKWKRRAKAARDQAGEVGKEVVAEFDRDIEVARNEALDEAANLAADPLGGRYLANAIRDLKRPQPAPVLAQEADTPPSAPHDSGEGEKGVSGQLRGVLAELYCEHDWICHSRGDWECVLCGKTCENPFAPEHADGDTVAIGTGLSDRLADVPKPLATDQWPDAATNSAMGHLGNVLSMLAELEEGDRCIAFESALNFYNERNPDAQVVPVEGYSTKLVLTSPIDRAIATDQWPATTPPQQSEMSDAGCTATSAKNALVQWPLCSVCGKPCIPEPYVTTGPQQASHLQCLPDGLLGLIEVYVRENPGVLPSDILEHFAPYAVRDELSRMLRVLTQKGLVYLDAGAGLFARSDQPTGPQKAAHVACRPNEKLKGAWADYRSASGLDVIRDIERRYDNGQTITVDEQERMLAHYRGAGPQKAAHVGCRDAREGREF